MLKRTFVLRDEFGARALWQFLKQNWLAMAQENKPLQVTVSEYKAKRSSEQNSRYWAIMAEIADSAWVGGRQYSQEVWHEHCKRKFIGAEELPDGSLISLSSTSLNVADFTIYMDKIEAYASTELGVEFGPF